VKEIEPKLHILVANAGATWGGPLDTTPDWANQKVLDLNVRAVFNMVKLYGLLDSTLWGNDSNVSD
jgi:NAD(P)-dependent dehydrogenase (short-subunit alcohol dehydrogenase family)